MNEIQEAMNKAGNLQGDIVMAGAAAAITNIATQTTNNHNFLKTELGRMTRDNLVKIQNTLDPKQRNGILKNSTIRNIIFKEHMDNFKKKENTLQVLREGMTAATKYMVLTCYAGDNTEIQWGTLKDDIEEIKKRMDENVGRHQANQAAQGAIAEAQRIATEAQRIAAEAQGASGVGSTQDTDMPNSGTYFDFLN